MGQLNWYGPTVKRKIRHSVEKSLRQIGEHVVSECARTVSTPQVNMPRFTDPLDEPPKTRTGELAGSYVGGFVGPLQYQVGNTSKHALWTELGTGEHHVEPSGTSGDLRSAERPAIVPKFASMMIWEWWKNTGLVWEREQVKGQYPRPVLVPQVVAAKKVAAAILKRNGI